MNNFVKNRVFKRSMWTLLTVFFALILIIFIIVTPITKQYEMFVDQFFGVSTRKQQVKNDSADPADFQYYTSEFSTKDENGKYIIKERRGINTQVVDKTAMRTHSEEIALQAVNEGTVVLWNNEVDATTHEKALPLAKGSKISNFGIGTINYIHHGIGSGKVTPSSEERLDIEKALTREGVGLVLNPTTMQAIRDGKDSGFGVTLGNTKDIPWDQYSSNAKNSVIAFKDAALFIITRYYGEGSTNKNDQWETSYDGDGNMFTLTKAEYSVLDGLKELKKKGRVNKIIVAVNSASPFNVKHFDRTAVDACLWIGYGGEMGPESLGDVLVGNVEPSGHLADTWAYDMYSSAGASNFGNYTYSSMPVNAPKDHDKYVVYQEGIYVGYKYYETRYEDVVLGRGNADNPAGAVMNKQKWSYTDEVAYTFGYGAGYNEYEYGKPSFDKVGDDYIVTVNVTNKGNMPGKDAVQVYLQKPYTQYDIDNKIEKSAVDLVGFAKTPVIDPGKTASVTITVPEYEFKSYDSYGAGTYILEAGDYYLSVGKDAHDALNNILAAKGKKVQDGMDYDGDANMAKLYNYNTTDTEKYSKGANGTVIQNQFDNADLLRNAEMKPSMEAQGFKWLSRSNWRDTWSGGVELALVGEENTKMVVFEKEIPNNPEDKMPIYGTDTSEFGHLVLAQLRGLDYDDELWDDLLNEMTFEQQVRLMSSCAVGAITGDDANSIMSPGITQQDGPVGVRSTRFALPSNPVNACTFNLELIHEIGVVFGTEMLADGWGGVYGLGCNIHRTPWGGRAYEYYSEDGFLTGAISSAETKGMREKGVILYTKHFALNDQEMNRGVGVNTWSNEQAIREIYLKGFETSIIEGGCNGLMTSYNAIGTTWAGSHKGLLTNVLRGEWGFTGITITDAVGSNPYMGGQANDSSVHAFANIAGQDAWMGGFGKNELDSYYNNKNATVCLAVRESAHRILYTQLHSLMMNGVSADTRFTTIVPGWETALLAIKVVSGVLAGICLGMVAASWVIWYLDNKKKDNLKPEV